MEKEGLRFPVLLAQRLKRELQGGYSIPQNWIIDGQGRVVKTQTGFSSDHGDAWLDEVAGLHEEAAGGEGK